MLKILIYFGINFFTVLVYSFNVSPVPNLIHSKPFTRPTDPLLRERAAYFGFSLLLRQKSILVGAPRANSTISEQSAIIEPGILYECSIFLNEKCEVFLTETRGNINYGVEKDTEIRHRQWLGATISGDQTETDNKSTFITCAPAMRTNHFFVTVGACYTFKNDRKKNITQYKPFANDIISTNVFTNLYYALANFGMSSHWIKERNLYLVGAPTKRLRGAYVRINLTDNTAHKDSNQTFETDNNFNSSFAGYSISAGFFNKENIISYVIAAPRYLDYGIVILINEHFDGNKTIYLKGAQKFEYFGYSTITEDLNNDGISDIIISAPLYTMRNQYETGAIYVYNGKSLINNENKIIIPTRRELRARFGSSLASLGDINSDGYNDIAVGAPYIENGRVFIYHGSADGLNPKPAQIIEAPSFEGISRPHYFGYAISGGVDVDGNGINDIAISAINTDTVYLYKTYEIVNVEIFFENFPQFIHFTKTNITVTNCIKFSRNGIKKEKNNKNLTFNLILKLNRIDNRIKFDDGSIQKVDTIVLKSDQKQCRDHLINIEHAENIKFYGLQLSYEHVQNKFQQNFCQECAVIHPEDRDKIVNEKLFIRHSCGNNTVCNSNLKVEIFTDAKGSLIANKNRHLNVSVKITNYIDTAYLPRLIITNEHNLSLSQVPSACSERNSIVYCNLWNVQLYIMEHGRTKTFDMTFDISNLQGSELIIEAKASSLSNEVDESDNTDRLYLNILKCSKVEVMEVSKHGNQNFSLYENQLEDIVIEKTFEIQNFGPSLLKNVTFVIVYPKLFDKLLSPVQSLEENFYDNNDNKMELSRTSNEIIKSLLPTKNFRNSGSYFFNSCEFTNFADFVNVQHQIAQNISRNEKITFDTEEDEVTKLKLHTFALEEFKVGSANTIKAIIKLKINQKKVWEGLEEYDKKFFIYNLNFLIVDSACWNMNSCEGPSINFRSELFEIIMMRIVIKKSAWIYATSFVLAILVYLIIAFILYKIGFFKRKKHEEVKEFKRESLRRQSSAARASQQPPEFDKQINQVELSTQENSDGELSSPADLNVEKENAF